MAKCSDGIDNDNNGFVDCGDYSCSQADDSAVVKYCASVLEVTFDRCSDDIDNDGNGYTDCEDYSCRNSTDLSVKQACQESLDDGTAKCSDGIDNDKDGYVDCDDWDCNWNPAVDICKNKTTGKPRVCGF